MPPFILKAPNEMQNKVNLGLKLLSGNTEVGFGTTKVHMACNRSLRLERFNKVPGAQSRIKNAHICCSMLGM